MIKTIYNDTCTSKKSKDVWNVYLVITFDEETEEYQIIFSGNSGKVDWKSILFRKYNFSILNAQEILKQDDELYNNIYSIDKLILGAIERHRDKYQIDKIKQVKKENGNGNGNGNGTVETIAEEEDKPKKKLTAHELKAKVKELSETYQEDGDDIIIGEEIRELARVNGFVAVDYLNFLKRLIKEKRKNRKNNIEKRLKFTDEVDDEGLSPIVTTQVINTAIKTALDLESIPGIVVSSRINSPEREEAIRYLTERAGLTDTYKSDEETIEGIKEEGEEYLYQERTVAEIKTEESALRAEIKQILKDTDGGGTDWITELLARYFKKNYKIFTIEDDKTTEMWIYEDGVYKPQGRAKITKIMRRILRENLTPEKKNKVELKVEADTYIDPSKFFNVNYLTEIPVQNGILNLETREVKPFTPLKIFFNKLPMDYNPKSKCPNVDLHFHSTLKGKDDVTVMYELFGYSLFKDNFLEKAVMFYAGGRNGKCLVKDSEVQMSDGSWKKVQDVKRGDEIISPQKDGTFTYSKVVGTHSRFEPEIYDVKESSRKKRTLYSCANNHLIPFYRGSGKELPSVNGKRRCKNSRVLDCKEAQELSKYAKSNISKSEITSFTSTAVDFKNKNSLVDPYLIGAWLGDGHFASRMQWKKMKNPKRDKGNHGYSKHLTIGITTKEPEIVEAFKGEIINVSKRENNQSAVYHFSTIGKFASELKRMNLLAKGSEFKFIPKECLLSSIEYRKQLLAGLIDTDGFVDKAGAINLTTKSRQLSEDIKSLVFSLGGYADIRNIEKSCQNGFRGKYFEVSIRFQNKTQLPLRTWKKARLKDIKGNPLMIGIEVVKREKGDWIYGFELDSKESPSQWHIVKNENNIPMVTHNTKTLELLKTFVGPLNIVSIPLQNLSDASFEVAELFGKMVNMAGDISTEEIKHTGTLKMLTGRDTLTAKRKFLTGITFMNFSKLIFACNELPKVYDTSKGFWSRWILFEFPYTFIKKDEMEELPEAERKNKKIMDPDIVKKLTTPEELSGLLNEALDGLDRIRKNKSFSYSKGTDEIMNFWIRNSDSFLAFCTSYLDIDYQGVISKHDLRRAYSEYCKKYSAKTVSDKAIKRVLQDHFGVDEEYTSQFGGNQVWGWVGVKWKYGQRPVF